jgi:peptidoglycan DL-endopeptidase LytF
MTRKNTIMIAVMVNAALLIGLFITAIKSDNVSCESLAEVRPIEPIHEPRKEMKLAQGDEIDQVLKDFSKQEKKESPQKIDFAKELEMITKSSVPPAQIEKTPAFPSSEIVVKVKQGDALEKIARTNNTTVAKIVEANHLTSTILQIGQTLKIPGNSKENHPKQQRGESSEKDEDFYVVQTGDNPWTIAVKNRIKVDELLKLNHLNEQKARRLKPGDKLRIR